MHGLIYVLNLYATTHSLAWFLRHESHISLFVYTAPLFSMKIFHKLPVGNHCISWSPEANVFFLGLFCNSFVEASFDHLISFLYAGRCLVTFAPAHLGHHWQYHSRKEKDLKISSNLMKCLTWQFTESNKKGRLEIETIGETESAWPSFNSYLVTR